MGLDTDRFERELAAHRYRDQVQEDVLSGYHGGVRGTPGFFINGVRHEGRWELEELLPLIEAAASARPPDEARPAT